MSTFALISLLHLLGLLSPCCRGSAAAAIPFSVPVTDITLPQQNQNPPTANRRSKRRRRKLGKWKDGPSSTEIDCSLSTVNYEYYIERCHDHITQWWINGHCINGVKEEVSEFHRCVRTDGSRPYCHDCPDPNGRVIKHVCGSDTPDSDEACGIAMKFKSTSDDCDAEQKLTAYSHQCTVHPLSGKSEGSWYLREVCDEGEVHVSGPDEFMCGQEWYYDFEEDEHESGEKQPFANEENIFCLDCGLAIQVCVSDGDATCESLGLEHPKMVGDDVNEDIASKSMTDAMDDSATENDMSNTPTDNNDVGKSIEEGHDVMNEEVDQSLTKDTEETVIAQDAADDIAKEAKNNHTSAPLEEEEPAGVASPKHYPNSHRSAWVDHGVVGALTFGLLVPLTMIIGHRETKYHHWIECLRGCMNILTFITTLLTVGTAISTMNGMGEAGEGHLKERHHIVGLMLLLLVSFQTANGFLLLSRSPVQPESTPDNDSEQHGTDTATAPSPVNRKSNCTISLPLLLWIFIFSVGAYQVVSGMALFSKRFGTPDWGQAYIGYIAWLAVVMLIGTLWAKWKEKEQNMEKYWNENVHMEGIQIGSEEGVYQETDRLKW